MKITNLLFLGILFVGYFSSVANATCGFNQKNYACCRKPVAFPGAPYTRVGGGCGYTRAGAVTSCALTPGDGIKTEWRKSGCDHLNPPTPHESSLYVIRNTYECPGHKWCNAELSWDGKDSHPMASVEFNDRVVWELISKGGNRYVIRSKYGCPDHKWCNAELSWDGKDPHPMASVEFNDRVEWELISKGGNRYVIRSKYGCPDHKWCNAELSWDGKDPHPMVSVEFNDRVEWELIAQ